MIKDANLYNAAFGSDYLFQSIVGLLLATDDSSSLELVNYGKIFSSSDNLNSSYDFKGVKFIGESLLEEFAYLKHTNGAIAMINIPLDVQVQCRDWEAGRSISVVADSITRKVTHFVADDGNGVERLVPIELVVNTSSDAIFLSCRLEELREMEPFVQEQFVVSSRKVDATDRSKTYYTPHVTAESGVTKTDSELDQLPGGMISVRRGTVVKATDGEIGKVDEILIDTDTGRTSHLIVLKGRRLRRKELAIPVSAVSKVTDQGVFLKLTKQEIDSLPAIQVERPWEETSVTEVEILVSVFDKSSKAAEVMEELKKLDREYETGLHNAAVLVKDEQGNTSFKESGDIDSRRGALLGAVTGGLFGLLAGPVGVVVGAAAGAATGGVAAGRIDMGFPDEFLKETNESLKPGTSAIVALVERAWDKVPLRLFEDNGGKISHLTLADEKVAELLKNIDEVEDSEA